MITLKRCYNDDVIEYKRFTFPVGEIHIELQQEGFSGYVEIEWEYENDGEIFGY